MNDKVAEGNWYYDGKIPRRIAAYRKEARLASSRFDRDIDQEPSLRLWRIAMPHRLGRCRWREDFASLH